MFWVGADRSFFPLTGIPDPLSMPEPRPVTVLGVTPNAESFRYSPGDLVAAKTTYCAHESYESRSQSLQPGAKLIFCLTFG